MQWLFGSVGYADLPNAEPALYDIKKKSLVNTSTDLKKVFTCWETVTAANTRCSKF